MFLATCDEFNYAEYTKLLIRHLCSMDNVGEPNREALRMQGLFVNCNANEETCRSYVNDDVK